MSRLALAFSSVHGFASWFLLGAVAVAVLAAASRLSRFGRVRKPAGPGARPKPLLSKWEAAELPRIAAQCPPGYHACPQVCLGSFLVVPRGAGTVAWKIVDYLVVDPTGRPVLAIELDDATHRASDRAGRDRAVEAALRRAGVPLLRVAPWQPVVLSGMLAEARVPASRSAPSARNAGTAHRR